MGNSNLSNPLVKKQGSDDNIFKNGQEMSNISKNKSEFWFIYI